MKLSRRSLLAGLGVTPVIFASTSWAQTASSAINATELGLIPDLGADQSAQLGAAIEAARVSGKALYLPGGRYLVSEIKLPSNCTISGLAGATILQGVDGSVVMGARAQASITIEGIRFEASAGEAGRRDALLAFEGCNALHISHSSTGNTQNNGIYVEACAGRIENCEIYNCGQTGIHLQNGTGMLVSNNSLSDCGNGGIRVWRSESGPDGTIITGNRIDRIGSGQGDGQNGNGVNIFRADGVIVSNNVIQNCAFSAVRANATNDTIITQNQCINSSEVAIFSEFAFSGSIISNNIIDGAARGISITNFNDGGRLAVCSNNIVRNILPFSPTNPNTRPVGIFAEADVAVNANVVENVPGVGIAAGWGPYLRNVLISNNIVRQTQIGIGVSVADGAGRAKIIGNLIEGAERMALAGLAWTDIISSDLVADAARFPHIELSNNSVY